MDRIAGSEVDCGDATGLWGCELNQIHGYDAADESGRLGDLAGFNLGCAHAGGGYGEIAGALEGQIDKRR